jgi:hypothetical protein
MAEQIFMQIGERGVDLTDFSIATQSFVGLLQEVDSSIARRKGGNLVWRLSTLRESPAPIIGATPHVRSVYKRPLDDISASVEREIIGNVNSITEVGERNKFLSDAALSRVEKIAKITPKIGASAIFVGDNGQVPLRTTVTVRTLDQLKDLTQPRSISFGTLVGSLDTISVHSGLEFRVYDDETNRPVRCFLDAKQRTRAMDLLGTRVVVTGMMRADRHGRPLSMEVETFNAVSDPGQLPTIEEMRGSLPDLTGGKTMKEFLEDE